LSSRANRSFCRSLELPDPIIRPGQGLNRYSYSWNNPLNLLDPSGLGPITDPCAGLSEAECTAFLNGNPQNTWAGNCELNATCSGGASGDPGYGWESESEEYLAQGMERRAQRGAETYVDCTQAGANCGDAPCATYGTCGTDPNTSGTTTTGGSGGTQPPLKYCDKHPDRCSAPAGGQSAGTQPTGVPNCNSGAVPCDTGVRLASIAPIQIAPPRWEPAPIPVVIGVFNPSGLGNLRAIAGSPLGPTIGYPFPVKPNFGGYLQPYNPATGRFMSYSANPGFMMSSGARFSAGFASGVGTAQGIPGPQPVGLAGNVGYVIGQLVGNFWP
jgi:hypothetical protein